MSSATGPDGSDRRAGRRRDLNELREKLKKRNATIAGLRGRLDTQAIQIEELREAQGREGSGVPFDPTRVVWIFGGSRTGSTWLGQMLGELGGLWNEPHVAALYGDFAASWAHRFAPADKAFILADVHRESWLASIRSFVLQGCASRAATIRWREHDGPLVIKEPKGASGAGLMSEAIPEAGMVLLVRDPRDVVISRIDARKPGGFAHREQAHDLGSPLEEVRHHASAYAWDLATAARGYFAHPGPKSVVRYEDLRAGPLEELARVIAELGLSLDEHRVAQIVDDQSWDRIPADQIGPGQRARKGRPAAWQDDLTAEEAAVVEDAAATVLRHFYSGEITVPDDPGPMPYSFNRARGDLS